MRNGRSPLSLSCYRLNCEYVWPQNFETGMELDTPEYWGRVKGDLIVEKQLAMGGSQSSLPFRVSPSTSVHG